MNFRFSKPKLWHSVYRSTYLTGFFPGCRQMHKNKHMHARGPLDLWRFQFVPPVYSPTVKSNKSLQTTPFPRLFHLKLVFDLSASHKSRNGLLIALFVELAYCCLFAGIYQDRDKRAFSMCVQHTREAHLWLCRAGWWGCLTGRPVCPPTLGPPGYQGGTSGCDRSTADWCCSSPASLMEEIADDYPPWGKSITGNQSAWRLGDAQMIFHMPGRAPYWR